MSVSLNVRWVFGYHDPTGEAFGLYHEEYGDCTVGDVECMGGDSGSLIYATASTIRVLNDRDGYEFPRPVYTIEDLPPTQPFIKSLDKLLGQVPENKRPKEAPRWILHVDMG